MTPALRLRVWLGVAALAAVSVALLRIVSSSVAAPKSPPSVPAAQAMGGVATVGPLFANGVQSAHQCTASVVSSPGHDMLLTAAHCLVGTAAGWLFVPGYDAGRMPYGVWTITHAYVDASWIATQDPAHDYAFVQVAKQRRGDRWVGVQDVAGANLLGTAPVVKTPITAVAYNAGLNDRPVSCTVAVFRSGDYPGFTCAGYAEGSSGSPWLLTGHRSPRVVVGVIGGLEQGGCTDSTSYTAPFGPDTRRLWQRAITGAQPDTVPAAQDNGC